MLAKIKEFVKDHQADIILLIVVILISLLSFALGYIVAKMEEKEPLKIEKSTNNEFITNKRIYEFKIRYSFIRKFVTYSLFADL